MQYLLGAVLILSAVFSTGCASYDLTAPQVCVEWGTSTNAYGDEVRVCKKVSTGSWL